MKSSCYLLLLLLVLPGIAFAQINRYFPDTWQETPVVHPLQDAALLAEPYVVLSLKIARDFNINIADAARGYTHTRTVYKNTRVNTQAGADSLKQIILVLETNEAANTFRGRVLFPDGQVADLTTERARLKDGRNALVIDLPALQPGCEVGYELTSIVFGAINGVEYFQAAAPTLETGFRLVTSPDKLFLTKTSDQIPPLTDSITGNIRTYATNTALLPALLPSRLYHYLPHLQRVEFAFHADLQRKGRDTVKTTWQQFGTDEFVSMMNMGKHEFKLLEKEIKKWPFLQKKMSLADIIYQVEHHLKTNFNILDDAPDNEGVINLEYVLKSKNTNINGMTRLMASVYYLLNIRTQLLITSSREEIPLDSNFVNTSIAKNKLLYFPDLGQALAPADPDTRFPYYPPLWSDTWALRCSDVLEGDKHSVKTDFVRTPFPNYTHQSISIQASLQPDLVQNTVQVKLLQSFGGYPGINIRDAFNAIPEEQRPAIMNAVFPFQYIPHQDFKSTVKDESWTAQTLDKPVTFNTTAKVALLEKQDNLIKIKLGALLTNQSRTGLTVPPDTIPIEMLFPYYQEKKIQLTIPDGYRVANKEDFQVDVHYPQQGEGDMGFKVHCQEAGKQLTIYVLEWYRKNVYPHAAKPYFQQLFNKVAALMRQEVILEKMN